MVFDVVLTLSCCEGRLSGLWSQATAAILLGLNDRAELIKRGAEVVIDQAVVILWPGLHFFLGGAEPTSYRRFFFCAAAAQSVFEFLW